MNQNSSDHSNRSGTDTPSSEKKVSGRNLAMLEIMLADVGLDFNDIARQVMHENDGSQPAHFSAVDYLRILARCAVELKDESFQLTNKRLLPGTNDFVLKNLGHCHSIKEVFQSIANAYNIIHGGTYNKVEIGERHIAYIIDDQDFPYSALTHEDHVHFILDNMLVFVHGIVASLLPRPVTPFLNKLMTRTAEQSLLDTTFSHLAIRHNANHYGIYYDLSIQDETLQSDPNRPLTAAQLYHSLEQQLDHHQQPPLVNQVLNLMARGILAQEGVADHLHLSVASLKRKLGAHQTSFRSLKHQFLNQQAQQHLLQGMSVEDCALTLGFCDVRSFNRAFKNWNGITPTRFLHP